MVQVQENDPRRFRLGVFDADSKRAEDVGERLGDLFPHIDVVSGATSSVEEVAADVDAAVIARPEDGEIESLYSFTTESEGTVHEVEFPTDSVSALVSELSTVVDTIFLYSQIGSNCMDYADLVEFHGDPSMILSLDYYCVYATSSMAETLSVDTRELLGGQVDSVLRPRGGSTLEKRFDEDGEQSTFVQFKAGRLAPNQWYEVSVTTLSDVVVLSMEEAMVRSSATSDRSARRDDWPNRLPRPAFTLTNDLRIDSWNEEASREFGWSETELHHDRLPYHTSFEQAFEDRCREVVDRDTIRDIDLQIETSEGDLRDVNCSLIPVSDRSGSEVLGVITEYADDRLRIESVRDLVEAIDATASRDQLFEQTVLGLDDVLRNSYVALFVRNRHDDHLRLEEHTPEALERFGSDPVITPDDEHLWVPFEERATRYVPDLDRIEGTPETDIRTELLVPLGQYGLLALGSTSVGAFGERERAFVELVANVVTTNVRHYRRNDMLHSYKDRVQHLTADLQAAVTESAMVRAVVNDCSTVANRTQFTQAVCESFLREWPAAFASYYDADTDGVRLDAWAQSNQTSISPDQFDDDAVDQFVATSLERQAVQSIQNASEELLGEDDAAHELEAYAVPVTSRNRTSGVLFVGLELDARETPYDRTYLQTLGRIVGLCLDTVTDD